MRFLADMGVSMSTVRALRGAGEEIVHLREEGLHKLPDGQILEKARRESRIVLTFDLDFGELLAAGGYSLPSVIIFRMRNQSPATVTRKLFRVIAECKSGLERAQSLPSTTVVTGFDRCRSTDYRYRPASDFLPRQLRPSYPSSCRSSRPRDAYARNPTSEIRNPLP